MSAIAHLPVVVHDEPIFEDLAKFCCKRLRKAAGLGKDFAPLHRHPADFLAKGLGRNSAGHLFATAPETLHAIKSVATRADVKSLLFKTLERSIAAMPPVEMEKLSTNQLLQMAQALPAIVQSAAEKLKDLKVDKLTLERSVLDPLLARHAPPYEFGILHDRRTVFIFERARAQLRDIMTATGEQSVRNLSTEQLRAIVRASFSPLVDLVASGALPRNHEPVVLADEDQNVVGITFQHPVHHGVVPVCCESIERYATIQLGLLLPGQAQMNRIPSDSMSLLDPNNIVPFRTAFTREPGPDLPSVLFAKVTPEEALKYLEQLSAARNGARVPCTQPDLKPLRGAKLNWVDISSPGSGTTRRHWGLVSIPNEQGPPYIMSSSGLLERGIQSDMQWYLRQTVWIDADDVPELALPVPLQEVRPYDNEPTKIIPASVATLYRKARARVDEMPAAKKVSPVVLAALKKLKAQDDLLRKVADAVEADTVARRLAVRASVTYQGYAAGVCRIPRDA